MDTKTRVSAVGIGLLALSGSLLGISLVSGSATAAPTTGNTAPSTLTVPADTASGNPSADVQSGQQSGPDSAAPDSTETLSTESSTSESNSASDGPGGHQDPSGNVDHQSTTEQ